MINFKPSDMDMLSLPLEIVVYLKISVVSLSRDDNYNFIKYLFSDEEMNEFFLDIQDTLFYDFDGRLTDQEKYINIFELYSIYNYDNTSLFLKEILEGYTHEADVIIDFFTHDSKIYRLSNLDGVVKLEEIIPKNAA